MVPTSKRDNHQLDSDTMSVLSLLAEDNKKDIWLFWTQINKRGWLTCHQIQFKLTRTVPYFDFQYLAVTKLYQATMARVNILPKLCMKNMLFEQKIKVPGKMS